MMMTQRCGRVVRASVMAAVAAALVAMLTSCQATGRRGARPFWESRTPPQALATPTRAIWVARFHYHVPEDIRTIMRNSAALGFNTVLFQVRGEATVAYPSEMEPWAREYEHRDPGFDPLAVAVEAAHAEGLRIEPWINVMPGWKGKKPPPDRTHLYYTHPEWYMHDAAGRRQALSDFYVILNPCLPEVRQHISDVVREIVTNYDVDGIHLDYIRYAWDVTPDARQNYPRDARTLALYRQDTGKQPDDDPETWDRWRANQLTRLVEQIRQTIDRVRPGATLTAATWRDPQRGYRNYFQNALAWLRAGLLDAAMPMAYTTDVAALDRDMHIYFDAVAEARVVPGLGIYKHETPEQLAEQLALCAEWGGDFTVFSYESLWPVHGDRGGKPEKLAEKQAARHMRRSVLEDWIAAQDAVGR
jgi:uncharacterized lipoprotein YddW (UPF0748 family)